MLPLENSKSVTCFHHCLMLHVIEDAIIGSRLVSATTPFTT